MGAGTLVLSEAKKKGKKELKGRRKGKKEGVREGVREGEKNKLAICISSSTHGNRWEQIGTCIIPL